MKKIIAAAFLFGASLAYSQTATIPIPGACVLPGVQANVSGIKSVNYLQGVIPSCTVKIYLTGTTTIATTTPQSPFTANTNGSIPPVYAATGVGYDVVLSGGIAPNTYPTPLTFTDIFAGGSGGGGGGCGSPPCTIPQGGTGAGNAGAAMYNLFSSPAGGNYSVQCSGTTCGLVPAPTGTVTGVSIATANGFQGTSSGGPTPVLTINVDSTHLLPVNNGPSTNYLNEAGGYSVPSGGGGYSFPITYTCTGTPSTDLTAINGYLSTPGTILYLDSQSHNCATNNQIILFSNDWLIFTGQTLVSTMPAAGDGDGNDEASITNEAIASPTTIARTCTLAATSTAVTSCSGAAFTNADVEQSFSCPNALASGVALQTSIGQVTSGTAIVLSDVTGSGITPGSFSCTETIRDHDIHILAGTISMTSVYSSPPRPQELAIGHANRVTVEGGNWIDPDGTSDWHAVFFDVSQVRAENMKFLSFSGFGQDGINFEGPWRNIAVQNITCDTSDDCVALKPGEWDGAPYNKPFRNTNGKGSGAFISNIQGSSGSHGVAIYAPGCVNASGTCVSSPITDVVIDTVIGQPITTDNGYPPSYGIGSPPVGLECLNGAASDCGTIAYADRIKISHVIGTSPTGGVNGFRVNIGSSGNMNQYFGNIQISDMGPDGSTYGGDVGAITVTTPSSMSFSTNINTLSIYDSGYTGNHGLFGITSSNATITNFFSDNPNLSLYTFSSATVTNKFIAGYYLSGNPVPSLATGYLYWNGSVFVWNAGTGSCSNALTLAASGGAAAGATYNCSAAVTADYHTLGAAPALTNNVPETTSWSFANNVLYRFTGSGASNATSPALVSGFTLASIQNVGTAVVTVASGGPSLVCTPACTIPAGGSALISTDGTNFDVMVSNAVQIQGVGIPSPSSGYLHYNGSAFVFDTPSGSGNTTSTSLTSNVLPKANGANSIVNSSVTDNGTTVTSTDTGGYVAPVFVANGTTAGFMDYPQGSDSGSVAPCNTATSICEEAPTSVTSYKVIKHGAAATGFLFRTNSSSVETETVVPVTGSGNVVLATSPSLTTPNIGVATETALLASGTQSISTATSGCSITSYFGGQTAGIVNYSASGTACVLTMTLPTSPTGWACGFTPTASGNNTYATSTSNTTTVTFSNGIASGTFGVSFECIGY